MARAYVYIKVAEYPPKPSWLTPSSLALCSDFISFLGMHRIFESTEERYTIRHRQVRSVIVQRTFCPLHIRYIFVLSIIHTLFIRQSPLVDRFLSATCPLHMPHRHRDDFHHRMDTGLTFLHFFCPFCPFGVRYPYPLICDSALTC